MFERRTEGHRVKDPVRVKDAEGAGDIPGCTGRLGERSELDKVAAPRQDRHNYRTAVTLKKTPWLTRLIGSRGQKVEIYGAWQRDADAGRNERVVCLVVRLTRTPHGRSFVTLLLTR